VKIFRTGEILSEKFRTENPAVLAFEETSICLPRKEELSGSEDDKRENAAEHHGEDERRTQGSKDFFEEGFHGSS
jgi:hypothetical protein